MTKNAYIHAIEKAAYIANQADGLSAQDWQTPDHARTHCQALLNLVRDIITPNAYQFWLDGLGEYNDIEAFEAQEIQNEIDEACPVSRIIEATGCPGVRMRDGVIFSQAEMDQAARNIGQDDFDAMMAQATTAWNGGLFVAYAAGTTRALSA